VTERAERAGRGRAGRAGAAVGRIGRVLCPRLLAALPRPVALDPPAPGDLARCGPGSWIAAPATIVGAEQVALGTGVIVMEQAEIRAVPAAGAAEPLVVIGDGTRLARFATIWATVGVEIGAGVGTSDAVAIIDCWRPPGAPAGAIPDPPAGRVVIGDGAYLGAGCVIGPGVVIGRSAYVGEGAVVTSDVAAHTVVYGNPARPTRHWTAEAGWRAAG